MTRYLSTQQIYLLKSHIADLWHVPIPMEQRKYRSKIWGGLVSSEFKNVLKQILECVDS
jgi:hypothetical protein